MISNMPLVIHHNDNDGFCSAWLAKQGLEKQGYDSIDFWSTNYGKEPPEEEKVKDRPVYILDFSYPRDMLLKLKEYAKSLVVIDHHKTAQADLEGLDFCIFDMNKAGCQLTREYFKLPSHWLVDYVEDRDLWRWRLDWSREVSAGLASYPHSFEIWDTLASRPFPDDLIKDGIVILRYQDRLIETACLCAEETEIGGYTVPVVNSTVLQSEVAQKLAEGKPFAATFIDKANGERIYQLRSTLEGIDVSKIAKQYGGGGHKHAAGFTLCERSFALPPHS